MDGYLLLLPVASKPTNLLDLPYPAQTFTLAFNLHPSSLPPLAGSRFNLWEKSNMDFYSLANRHYSTYERCQTWISILWQVDTSCTVPFLANCTQHMAPIRDVNKVITSYIVLVGSFTRKNDLPQLSFNVSPTYHWLCALTAWPFPLHHWKEFPWRHMVWHHWAWACPWNSWSHAKQVWFRTSLSKDCYTTCKCITIASLSAFKIVHGGWWMYILVLTPLSSS